MNTDLVGTFIELNLTRFLPVPSRSFRSKNLSNMRIIDTEGESSGTGTLGKRSCPVICPYINMIFSLLWDYNLDGGIFYRDTHPMGKEIG